MKNTITIAIATLLIAGLIGCEKYTSGFDSNPLAPVDASAQKTFVGAELGYIEFTEGFPAFISAIWSQQIHGGQRQFSAYDVYTVNNQDFSNDWFNAYVRVLANLKTVETKTAASGDLNMKGAAEILEGVHMGTVTAVWGDVPYSQAGQPGTTLTPVYDAQQSVYAAAQASLSAGITDMTTSNTPLTQDAFSMGGSVTRWVKLAHSAKARYYMHVARSAGYSSAALNSVLTEAAQGILALNGSEDAMMTHGITYLGNMNLWYSFLVNDGSGYMDASPNFAYPMMKRMSYTGSKTQEAGRMAKYYNSTGTDLNYTSTTGAFYQSASYPIIRASETHLLLAEANQRLAGTTNVDPTALAELNNARTYNNNIFGNTSQPFVPGDFADGAALLQTILNEEYLSLMSQIEAWNLVRRIDYGITYKDSAGASYSLAPRQGTQWPERFVYSVDELNANPNMPPEAAGAQYIKTWANQ